MLFTLSTFGSSECLLPGDWKVLSSKYLKKQTTIIIIIKKPFYLLQDLENPKVEEGGEELSSFGRGRIWVNDGRKTNEGQRSTNI